VQIKVRRSNSARYRDQLQRAADRSIKAQPSGGQKTVDHTGRLS
jgi:hypothetical protein